MDYRELDDGELQIIEDVVAEFEQRRRKGEHPGIHEFSERHPKLAQHIKEALSTLLTLHDLTPVSPTASVDSALERIPERIGDYRIIRLLGRGGMGVVYQAVQESLDRSVALKVLPSVLLADDTARERFRREAHIIAQLHHTNIVPVFGSGYADGVDYYAMQYIEGESLDRAVRHLVAIHFDPYGKQENLSREAIESLPSVVQRIVRREMTGVDAAPNDQGNDGKSLHASNPSMLASAVRRSQPVAGFETFVASIGLQAARALEHAHSRGILHRDVKPSNLILDDQGTVWVADFGLAKQSDTADLTSMGNLVGTLRFMAPERFRGAADARSDIYSLGLTLYELLAFQSPFGSSNGPSLIRQILDAEPTPLRVHRANIAPDLERIVQKAIAKDPASRYLSARALANDLDRFMRGLPVSARPIGLVSSSWRWCKRNPIVAGLASSLFLVLTLGLALTTMQWRRAEHSQKLAVESQRRAELNLQEVHHQRERAELNVRRARQAVDDYLTTVSENTLLDVPSLAPLRLELLERAKVFYEGFVADDQEDTALKVEMAAGYIRLGQVIHGVGGDWCSAVEKGLTLLEELAELDLPTESFQSWREGVYNTRDGRLRTEEVDRVRALLRRAVVVFTKLMEDHPDLDGFKHDLSAVLQMQGMVHLNEREYQAAGDDFRRALAMREELAKWHPGAVKYQYVLAESHVTIGIVHLAQGEPDDCLKEATIAKSILEPYAEASEETTQLADVLALVHYWIAAAHFQKKNLLLALQAYQEVLKIQERLARDFPYISKYQLNVALSYRTLGHSLFEANLVGAAKRNYQKAIDHLEQRVRENPRDGELKTGLTSAYLEFARELDGKAAHAEAQQISAQARAWAEQQPDKSLVVRACYRQGRAASELGQHQAAAKYFQEAVVRERELDLGNSELVAIYLFEWGRATTLSGQAQEAVAPLLESISLSQAEGPTARRRRGFRRAWLARTYEALEQKDDAAKAYALALEELRSTMPDEHPNVTSCLRSLLHLHRSAGRWREQDEVLSDHRRFRALRDGVQFAGPWTIQIATEDGLDSASAESSEDSDDVPGMSADAVDFIWGQHAPWAEAPDSPFVLTATSHADLPAGNYRISIQAADNVRLTLNGNELWAGKPAGPGESIPCRLDGSATTLGIEYTHETGQPLCRLWLTPDSPVTADD